MKLKSYYDIAKPGMVYGNLIPAICAFFFASNGMVLVPLLIAMTVGIGLVMASACVFNNIIDHDIDAKMTRTKGRVMVERVISRGAAAIYGTILGLLGMAFLILQVNVIAAIVAAVGFVSYVVLYTLWTKRRSPWGTEAGSISGAIPAVVGYVAVTGQIDLAAILLFVIMALWQMPHFYAVAIRRADEYAAAKIPVLSVVRGIRTTKWWMLVYITAFIVVAPLLSLLGYASGVYLAVALILGIVWLVRCIQGLFLPDHDAKTIRWAKQMFFLSLIVMITLFITIAVTPV